MFSRVPNKEKDCWYTIPQVRAKRSPIHGLGLFATDTIHRGTMIERSPVIICDRYTYKCIDDIMGYRHILSDYPYKWNRHESAFALGYSSLINHNHDNPSVLFKFNYDMPAIEFYAKRTIEAGEELTMQYVPEYALDKLWFEVDKRFDNSTQITPPNHIGLTAGSFDLMHAGHIQMLKEAKTVCQHLIVAVQEDPSVDRPDKNKPIQTYDERIEMVSACKHVNEVVLYKTEEDLYALLQEIQPDVRIIGSDWQGKKFTGYDLDIEVYFNSREHTYSTSNLRKRVFLAESQKVKNEKKQTKKK